MTITVTEEKSPHGPSKRPEAPPPAEDPRIRKGPIEEPRIRKGPIEEPPAPSPVPGEPPPAPPVIRDPPAPTQKPDEVIRVA
ncbi:hypothetical protein [Polyangium mundeleinium]|uniref:Uncharacterized protein n=1 Tax=Polyangium mundeleinium TaxID=2995306 RepID=A0ABT5EPM1_9BACT|nr:hypothetical protein [Polyangium mundeleinium]MDC0743792.1 hypothetical protein [Polyangium mundeleinium]